MSNKQFTLDIEPSSSKSTMDEDTEDEKSINQIVELPQSQEDVVDVSDYIILTQHCTIVHPTPTITKKTKVTDDLQDIAIKIKQREEVSMLTTAERKLVDESCRHEKGYGASICRIETRFFNTMEECGTDSLKNY